MNKSMTIEGKGISSDQTRRNVCRKRPGRKNCASESVLKI